MIQRWFNAFLWGNSVALAWMWGLGLFFSVQITFLFGLKGLLTFAVPNAIGLTLFGFLTHIVANREKGGSESLAIFFEKFAKPFRLTFYLYQILAIALSVFALVRYLFIPLQEVSGILFILFLALSVFVVLAAGCLFGEEFGIRKIKLGHGIFGIIILVCIVTIAAGTETTTEWRFLAIDAFRSDWLENRYWGYAIPLLVGLLVGPWLDLQQWQRAIEIHREKLSIRLSFLFGGVIFFLLLLFHGGLAMWAIAQAGDSISTRQGIDDFAYAHDLITQWFKGFDPGAWAPIAYYTFLAMCILTTLDSGYVALKWYLGKNAEKSDNMLLSIIPKQLFSSPIPSFLLIGLIAIAGLVAKLEVEYFMVFYASFFVGYGGLAIARCFVPNSQEPLPQIRMFSMAFFSLVLFAFGFLNSRNELMFVGALIPLAYVVWLISNTDLLRVVSPRGASVDDAQVNAPHPATATSSAERTGAPGQLSPSQTNPVPTQQIGPHPVSTGHFEGKWFVYSMIASYSDTNSVGNVYFAMYPMFVGKARELFFNVVMPDFDLKTTKFFILTRSFEHKFVREAREFDTITVKIRVADANRKFCTLEHQIIGSDGKLLGKGKQSLLFVSAENYALLDIPAEVHSAFMKYL